MSPQVIAAMIGVSSVLLGTFTGGFISYLSNRNLKLKEWRLSLIKEEVSVRRKIYSDFLSEANRLILYSLEGKFNSARNLDMLTNYFSQIELVSTAQVIEQARNLVSCIVISNTESIIKSNQDFYRLKEYFIESVKNELAELDEK